MLEQKLQSHQNKSMCCFITCGSVDDGKSTLIGRLLYDCQALKEEEIQKINIGGGDRIDFASITDGLSSEAQQGITIDVAYRFFSTSKRNFIIADTPGHEQYTRNMVTGASNADIAIILIDALKGISLQTKRHTYITTLLDIKQIIVAINKMDLFDFSYEKFEEITINFKQMFDTFQSDANLTFIPISALLGDNITHLSSQTPYYQEGTLLELLETLPIHNFSKEFRFLVQSSNRYFSTLRGYCGNIISGEIKVGDHIQVFPSNQRTKIKAITSTDFIDPTPPKTPQDILTTDLAFAPMPVTLFLEDEIDIERGSLLCSTNPKIADTLSLVVIWFNPSPLELNTTYLIKRSSTLAQGRITKIYHKKDLHTLQSIPAQSLQVNDIAQCTLVLDSPLAFDSYKDNHTMGGLIFIDKYTYSTLGAGIIIDSLKTSSSQKTYSQAEKALNEYICLHYPEWGCKKI